MRPSSSWRRIVRSERTTRRFYGRRMLALLSMAGRDLNADFRERRRARRRRQVRIRRTVAIGVLLAAVAGIALGARAVDSGGHPAAGAKDTAFRPPEQHHKRPALPAHVPAPNEVRGVHVTMALASLPGKLKQYLVIPGLNAVEL